MHPNQAHKHLNQNLTKICTTSKQAFITLIRDHAQSRTSTTPIRDCLRNACCQISTIKMQYRLLTAAFVAFAITGAHAYAASSPQVVQCETACSTNCIPSGHDRGGTCDSHGSCTCLIGQDGEASLQQIIESRQLVGCDDDECSHQCQDSGDSDGGACDTSASCECW